MKSKQSNYGTAQSFLIASGIVWGLVLIVWSAYRFANDRSRPMPDRIKSATYGDAVMLRGPLVDMAKQIEELERRMDRLEGKQVAE